MEELSEGHPEGNEFCILEKHFEGLTRGYSMPVVPILWGSMAGIVPGHTQRNHASILQFFTKIFANKSIFLSVWRRGILAAIAKDLV